MRRGKGDGRRSANTSCKSRTTLKQSTASTQKSEITICLSLRYHSTETALVKVANDILLNMNLQRVTLLVLLDLSAAFDTVDHAILLKRLTTDFGIGGKALEWLSSYLSGRSQRVLFEGATSDSFDLRFGVSQGSCLGPLRFVVYASKLFDIVQDHLPNAPGGYSKNFWVWMCR